MSHAKQKKIFNRKITAFMAKLLHCKKPSFYALTDPDNGNVYGIVVSCHSYDIMTEKADEIYENKPNNIEEFLEKDGKSIFLDAFEI